jgi:hypothetical protein
MPNPAPRRPAILAATLLLAVLFVPAGLARAQKYAPPPPAPLPSQIVSAQKVFISFAGANNNFFNDSKVTDLPDDPYNAFYAAMKSWNHYRLVSTPAQADLIFQIRLTNEVFLGAKTGGYDPQLHLLILDPRSGVALWGFVEHIQPAILHSTAQKNFSSAMEAVVSDVKTLTARAASPTP